MTDYYGPQDLDFGLSGLPYDTMPADLSVVRVNALAGSVSDSDLNDDAATGMISGPMDPRLNGPQDTASLIYNSAAGQANALSQSAQASGDTHAHVMAAVAHRRAANVAAEEGVGSNYSEYHMGQASDHINAAGLQGRSYIHVPKSPDTTLS